MKKSGFLAFITFLTSVTVFQFPNPADTGDIPIEPFEVASSYVYIGWASTIEDYIKMGGYIVLGGGPRGFIKQKGHCPVCHSFFRNKNFRDRAPNLFGIEEKSRSIILEERYFNEPIKVGDKDPATGFIKGKPQQVNIHYRRKGDSKIIGEDYLRESLMCPSCYIAKDLDEHNDKNSKMPAIHNDPIRLSPFQLNAVIAWMQYKDTKDLKYVTISLPSSDVPAPFKYRDIPKVLSENDPIDVMINKLGCPQCHIIPVIEGSSGELGPPLYLKTNGPKRLGDPNYKGRAKNVREYVEESIMKPHLYVVLNEETGELYPDALMPPYYSDKTSARALEKLLDFLVQTEAPIEKN